MNITKAELREKKKRPRMHMQGRGLRNVLALWQTRKKQKKSRKNK